MSASRARKNRDASSSSEDDDVEEDEEEVQLERRGRKGKLNPTMRAWLSHLDPTHDCKVAPFNGKNVDDDDLKEWVDTHWSLFAIVFAQDIDNSEYPLSVWEKTIRERYKNRRCNYLKRQATNAKDQTTALIALLNSRINKGYFKFLAANKDEVNKLVNEEREAHGISHTKHAAMFQEKMGKLWQEQTQEIKNDWNDAARNRNFAAVYANQPKLHDMLLDLLNRSQGFELHQSGDSAHLIVSTFRDKDGELQNSVGVVEGKREGVSLLDDILSDLKIFFLPKWDAYAAKTIPDTVAETRAGELAAHGKEDPPPLLKEPANEEEEDDLRPSDIRSMLEEYFIELWAYSQSDGDKAIPWEEIAKDPGTFLVSSFFPPTIAFNHPKRIPRDDIVSLRALILKHQRSTPLEPFVLFADKAPSASPKLKPKTRRKARLSGASDLERGVNSITLDGVIESEDEYDDVVHDDDVVLHMDVAEEVEELEDEEEGGLEGEDGEELSAAEDDDDGVDDDDVDPRVLPPGDIPGMKVFMPLQEPEDVVVNRHNRRSVPTPPPERDADDVLPPRARYSGGRPAQVHSAASGHKRDASGDLSPSKMAPLKKKKSSKASAQEKPKAADGSGVRGGRAKENEPLVVNNDLGAGKRVRKMTAKALELGLRL